MRKKAGVLFLLKFLKIPVYILNLSLTAKYFGVSLERDAWLLAFGAMMFIDNALWGPINETFRAKFIIIKEKEGERIAIEKTKSLLFFIIFFSIFISLLLVIQPDILSGVVAPKFSSSELEVFNTIIRYTSSCLLVNQLMQISISVLNAYDSFYIPEIAGFITSSLTLLFIIWLAPVIGIYSLLVSYLFGTVILIVMLTLQMKKLGVEIFGGGSKLKFTYFKEFFKYSLPMYVPFLFLQLNTFVEKILASKLGLGLVSIIDYSRKFSELMLTVFVSVITSLLMPALTKNFIRGNEDIFIEEFLRIFKLGILIISIVAAVMFCGGNSIIDAFYNKGNIAVSKLQMITELSQYFILGLVGVFVNIIFGMTLMSSERTKIFATIIMITNILIILFNVIFIKYLGVYVFPISLLVFNMIGGYLIFYFFPFRRRRVFTDSTKYLAFFSSTVFAAFLLGKLTLISNHLYLNEIVNFLFFIPIFFILLAVFKIEEMKLLIHVLKNLRIKNMK